MRQPNDDLARLQQEVHDLNIENDALAERINELEGGNVKGMKEREAHAFERMEYWRSRSDRAEDTLDRVRSLLIKERDAR